MAPMLTLNNCCTYFKRILLTISVNALILTSASADANSVMNYSEIKLLSVCVDMAEAVSLNAPIRVDKITVMLGAVCVTQTKTFIYKYETTEKLNATMGKQYVIRHMCADPIRKAFMYRGIVFRHTYVMPIGQQMFDVRYSDC